LGHRELGQPVELELRDHDGRVDPPRRRLHLRLETHAAMLAHQVDRFEHQLVGESARFRRARGAACFPARPLEVREQKAVLVVVDLRVAGELDVSAGDGGVDAQVREWPFQLDVGARRTQVDGARGELSRGYVERAVGSLQRPAQRAVHASPSASSVPPQRNLGARSRREAFGERGAP